MFIIYFFKLKLVFKIENIPYEFWFVLFLFTLDACEKD